MLLVVTIIQQLSIFSTNNIFNIAKPVSTFLPSNTEVPSQIIQKLSTKNNTFNIFIPISTVLLCKKIKLGNQMFLRDHKIFAKIFGIKKMVETAHGTIVNLQYEEIETTVSRKSHSSTAVSRRKVF